MVAWLTVRFNHRYYYYYCVIGTIGTHPPGSCMHAWLMARGCLALSPSRPLAVVHGSMAAFPCLSPSVSLTPRYFSMSLNVSPANCHLQIPRCREPRTRVGLFRHRRCASFGRPPTRDPTPLKTSREREIRPRVDATDERRGRCDRWIHRRLKTRRKGPGQRQLAGDSE